MVALRKWFDANTDYPTLTFHGYERGEENKKHAARELMSTYTRYIDKRFGS